jgi:hypothetical protein
VTKGATPRGVAPLFPSSELASVLALVLVLVVVLVVILIIVVLVVLIVLIVLVVLILVLIILIVLHHTILLRHPTWNGKGSMRRPSSKYTFICFLHQPYASYPSHHKRRASAG